jgi:hypothetical protein
VVLEISVNREPVLPEKRKNGMSVIAIGIDTGIGIDTTCLVTVGLDTPVQYYYGMPTRIT